MSACPTFWFPRTMASLLVRLSRCSNAVESRWKTGYEESPKTDASATKFLWDDRSAIRWKQLELARAYIFGINYIIKFCPSFFIFRVLLLFRFGGQLVMRGAFFLYWSQWKWLLMRMMMVHNIFENIFVNFTAFEILLPTTTHSFIYHRFNEKLYYSPLYLYFCCFFPNR